MNKDHRNQKSRLRTQRAPSNQQDNSFSSSRLSHKKKSITKNQVMNHNYRVNSMQNQSNLSKKISNSMSQSFIKEDLQVCRAFRSHGKNVIKKHQVMFSLKFLGFSPTSHKDLSFFDNIWKKYSPLVNLPQFRQIYEAVKQQGLLCAHQQIFSLMSKDNSSLDKSKFSQILQVTNNKLDVSNMLQICGINNIVDFEQFDHILKVVNAFSQ